MAQFGTAYLLLVNLPVFIVCLAGLFYYKWGTQIYVTLLDSLTLTLITMALQIVIFKVNQMQVEQSSAKKVVHAILEKANVSEIDLLGPAPMKRHETRVEKRSEI